MRTRLSAQALMARLIMSCGVAVVPLCGDPIVSTGPGGAAPAGDGPGPGQVLIYSNFGPGGSFNTSVGWTIGPVPNATTNQAVGDSFTTATDVRFADAQLAMFSVGGTSTNVYLETDAAGLPGTILDTLVEQSPIGSPAGIVTFDCQSCPLLSAGSTYWIVAGDSSVTTAWNWNDVNDMSGNAINENGSITGPWNFPNPETRGAFEVDGSVPEPSSITLLAAVVLALSLVLRRKVARPRRQAPSSEG